MVTDLPDYSKKVIVVYEGTIVSGEVKVDHVKIKGLTLKDPYVALCIPSSIENPALAYESLTDRFKCKIEAWDIASIVADISDDWTRQLGQVDVARVLGAVMAHSNPLYTRLTNGSAFIDPRDRNWTITEALARSWNLSASDIVSVLEKNATGLKVDLTTNTIGLATEVTLGTVHGHVDSIDGKITACNTGAVVLAAGTASIGKLGANSGVDIGDVDVASYPANTTRGNMTVKPEREDIVSLGGVSSPNAAGVELIAPNGTKKLKIYDAEYEALAAGLHCFYFGTTTTLQATRFLSGSAIGKNSKTFVQPRISAASDGLYLYSAVSETNMPYDIGYVQET